MNDLSPELTRLGNLLERRVEAQVSASRRPDRKRRGTRRALAGVAIALAVIVTGAGAYASVKALTTDEVERGLPGGSLIFEGTSPSCTTSDDTVFECTLQSAPTEEVLDDYTDSAQLFTDDSGNIAGGCRGQDAEGLRWTCYVGQRAVAEEILVADLLGQHVDSPTRG